MQLIGRVNIFLFEINAISIIFFELLIDLCGWNFSSYYAEMTGIMTLETHENLFFTLILLNSLLAIIYKHKLES